MNNRRKYPDQESYNRYRKLNALIKLVYRKVPYTVKNFKEFITYLGVTEAHLEQLKEAHRSKVFPEVVNELIDVFTDEEFANYYNIERIMAGKVKAFQASNPRDRLVAGLLNARDQHCYFI